MLSAQLVGGHELREVPFPGRKTKFVMTDDEAWFLAFEDDVSVPHLVEMLVRVFGIDPANEGERVGSGRETRRRTHPAGLRIRGWQGCLRTLASGASRCARTEETRGGLRHQIPRGR